MRRELKQVSKISRTPRKTWPNLGSSLTNLGSMKTCSSSPKARHLGVPRSLMRLRSKWDGCRNYGNTSRNVKTDSMSIWSSSGPKWMSTRCKTKSKKWDKDFNLSKSTTGSAAPSSASVNRSRGGAFSFLWLLILSMSQWSHLTRDTGLRSKTLWNRNSKLTLILSWTCSGTWGCLTTNKQFRSYAKLLKMKPRWRNK